MRADLKALLLTVISLMAGVCAAQSHKSAKPPKFSITISTKESTVKAGSEVQIQIAITNISEEKVMLAAAPRVFPYEVDIRDTNGNLLPQMERGKEMREWQQGVTYGEFVTFLRPSETQQMDCVASEWNDMNNPGTYVIQVQRWGHPSVKSNKLTVTVTP
jgi:hypothetical protein